MSALLLTQAAAARYVGVSRARFRAWVAKGAIPTWTDPVSGRTLYSKPALDRWLEGLDDRRAS